MEKVVCKPSRVSMNHKSGLMSTQKEGRERRRWSVELWHPSEGQSDVCLQLFVVNWCGKGDVELGGRGVRGECRLQTALGELSRAKATYLWLFELGQAPVQITKTGRVIDSNRRAALRDFRV